MGSAAYAGRLRTHDLSVGKGGDLVLARDQKQVEGPALFLLSSPTATRHGYGDTIAEARLRLRKWETRRAWAGRLLIALSFPMAYLLMMVSIDARIPHVATRVLIWLWVTGAAIATVCAEAAWRHKIRLDRLGAEVPPGRTS
jgi:hypothetical protein